LAHQTRTLLNFVGCVADSTELFLVLINVNEACDHLNLVFKLENAAFMMIDELLLDWEWEASVVHQEHLAVPLY